MLQTNAAIGNGAVGPPGRSPLSMAGLLGVLAFVVYNANCRLISSGDNYPARYLPFCLLKHGTVKLDPIAATAAQGDTHPYWLVEKYGYVFSRYPIAVPLLVAPLYVPAVCWLNWQGWTERRLECAARIMEKLSAAAVASASVALMYLLLRARTACRHPVLLTLAYAFGANTWMISGQALWQHGVAELLVALALFLLLGPCTSRKAFWTGATAALIACARPADVWFTLAFGAWGMRWACGCRGRFLMGGALPAALLLAYNLTVTRHVIGGYAVKASVDLLDNNIVEGVLGLLVSPARGLLTFTPMFLFVPYGLTMLLRQPGSRFGAAATFLAFGVQLLMYATLDWRAGCAWGPRWLTDATPILAWALAAGWDKLGSAGRGLFLSTAAMSVAVQAIGAFWYTGASDAALFAGGRAAEWDIRQAPFLTELRHPPGPRELFLHCEGFVDRVALEGIASDQVAAGASLEVHGWALADRRTPHRVHVVLAPDKGMPWNGPDQCPRADATAFHHRPDVNATKDATGAAGWQVSLRTAGLKPGRHRLEVSAQAHEGGEFRPVASRVVEIVADSDAIDREGIALREHFGQAHARLAARQLSDGCWLTAFTATANYDSPTAEMNSFTTALLVDVLRPIAESAGMADHVRRAEAHLAGHLEPSGLVRYHGVPDGPAIPSLGRIITPDADDTALAWRIAGRADDPRRREALKTLAAYRRGDGMYRTWLAPVAQYVSIDPGRDPNPADIAINMHVLMFLAGADRPAAAALHRRLRDTVADPRIWVYYEQAPLVPILRQADLRALGFPVEVPPERAATAVAGQQPWVECCRLLAASEGLRDAEGRKQARALLNHLAKDGFAALRRHPPLMYHNDLTAKCRRYYWSEDFGLALWLRLHFESSGPPTGGP